VINTNIDARPLAAHSENGDQDSWQDSPQDSPQDSWVSYRLLSVIANNRRSSALANLINATIVAMVFAGHIPLWALGVGFAVLVGLIGWRLEVLASLEMIRDDLAALRAMTHKIEYNAAGLGLWWGGSTAALLYHATGDQRMLLGIIAAGMMGAGSISFRSQRRAAQLYITLCGSGALLGFANLGTTPALAACCLTICYVIVLRSNIVTNAASITDNIIKQRDSEQAADTIRMLLNDFTEQGSDWLFELDSLGCLINPGERLAEAALRPVQTLEGKPFVGLFEDGKDAQALAGHLHHGRAFRHCIVPLVVGAERRWWSISARPTFGGGDAGGLAGGHGGGGMVAFRGVVTDITAQRQAEEKVSYMAHYDGLTDLPNRFLFNEQLYHAFNRRGGDIGLMYLDLDNFKTINDTLGHPVGDELLKAVARRLETCVSRAEVVSRLGGDEFAILVATRNLHRIETMATRIVEALAEPFELDGHHVVIGTSVGIARAPEHGENGEKLLQNADLALYTAKARGRNRAAMFEHGMDEAAHARRMLELDLRSSLGKDEMRLHYQPVIDIASAQVSGYEALIRWEHPTRGVVMPNDFIAIAEETGMIIQIGEWVIRQAMRDLAGWPEHLNVAINLSAAQMRSPSLVTTVINALAHNQVAPGRVCLEITETVLMQDSEINIETLHKLSALGVAIALDDFGTGYSSLNYLRSFPFNKIKIDRCFVDDIDTREDCQAIVRSVVALANSLGMTTTAEGVERHDQLEQLRLEGCGEVQGFLYSKALPVHELTDLRMPSHGVRGALGHLPPPPPRDGALPDQAQGAKRARRHR